MFAVQSGSIAQLDTLRIFRLTEEVINYKDCRCTKQSFCRYFSSVRDLLLFTPSASLVTSAYDINSIASSATNSTWTTSTPETRILSMRPPIPIRVQQFGSTRAFANLPRWSLIIHVAISLPTCCRSQLHPSITQPASPGRAYVHIHARKHKQTRRFTVAQTQSFCITFSQTCRPHRIASERSSSVAAAVVVVVVVVVAVVVVVRGG